MLSCRLEFECTNNTAEYEALFHGLYKIIGLNVKYLKVYGDSEIVIRQVKNLFIVFQVILNIIKPLFKVLQLTF